MDAQDRECRERWPEARSGEYDPRCCRWPKSCSVSADVDDETRVTDADLEPVEAMACAGGTPMCGGGGGCPGCQEARREQEGTVVPLVTYEVDGTRLEIGSAEVREDGSVVASIDTVKAPVGLLTEYVTSFSFGLGRPPAERDGELAALRRENERLSAELEQAKTALADQLLTLRDLAGQVDVLRGTGVPMLERPYAPRCNCPMCRSEQR